MQFAGGGDCSVSASGGVGVANCPGQKIIIGFKSPLCNMEGTSFATDITYSAFKYCQDLGDGSLQYDSGSQECKCPDEKEWVSTIVNGGNRGPGACKDVHVRGHETYPRCDDVHDGKPIYPLTGAERYTVELARWLGMPIRLTYGSHRMIPQDNGNAAPPPFQMPSFDGMWESNIHKMLKVDSDNSGYPSSIQASRGEMTTISLDTNRPSVIYGALFGSPSQNDWITFPNNMIYHAAESGAEEIYQWLGQGQGANSGKLLSMASTAGAQWTYTYSDGSTPTNIAPSANLIIKITDWQGRSINISYVPGINGYSQVGAMTGPDGAVIAFSYDRNGRLSSINWPDGTSRTFLYERADLLWALTGVIDENNSRYATITYDAQGYATDTQLAGGVNHFTAAWENKPTLSVNEGYDPQVDWIWRDSSWNPPTGVTFVSPNGQSSLLAAQATIGGPRLVTQGQPAGSGCTASSSSRAYDANGNVTQNDDFNADRTCYVNDMSRNLELVRVEGLGTANSCSSVTGSGSSLPNGARKITTAWHPNWRLPINVARPRSIETNVYNGQPDPFNGNAIASCAPTSAVLPDGSPIVVLCKQVLQATTDGNGASGTAAVIDTSVPARITQYTYNASGQLLTQTDPLGHTSTNVYYASAGASNAVGDLQSTSNALGQTTQYTAYDGAGRLTSATDPNGVVTSYAYDPLGRLKTTTVGTEVTTMGYDKAGQLISVQFPNGTQIGYQYDAAHRLVQVNDQAGNSVQYTLDNTGNRISEVVKDPNGVLAHSITRVYDALNRLQSVTGAQQ